MATPVSLALVSDLVSLPSCRCYSWPSGTAGGSGRLQGGDQTVDGLGVRCEGIRGSIAPRVDRLVADRAVSVGRSIHGGQCATRIGAQAPADLVGLVPLGKSAIARRRRTL